MKIFELQGALPGTFAGVRLSTKTVRHLQVYQKENDIQNPVLPEKFHITILYSRKPCPDFEPAGQLVEPIVGQFKEWDLFPSQPDENGNRSNCLVMKLTCPELEQRHARLMKEHGATFDFDEYIPHLTLSYDVGDINVKALPEFLEPIIIVSEYYQPLKQ